MRIAILGAGNVGGALGKGWARTGHAIAYGLPDPSDPRYHATAKAAGDARLGTVAETVRDAEVIVLAVPFEAAGDALAAAGDLSGRILIDVTNPLRMGATGLELSIGFDRSGGEHVASLARNASVFKTLNQAGFEVMADASGYAARPVMFVAGDDAAKKPVVMGLVSDLGFQAVDAGALTVARLLEPFAMLWIHMALERNAGRDNAFAYLSRTQDPGGAAERNKRLVIEHFDDFVNKKDLGAIDRNMAPGFVDHDGSGGKQVDCATDRAMMATMHKQFPDLRVEVRDAIAEGDKVVVRNVWTGTNAQTGRRLEFHGFVLWRIEGGKIAERWATVTPMQELAAQVLEW